MQAVIIGAYQPLSVEVARLLQKFIVDRRQAIGSSKRGTDVAGGVDNL